MSGGKAYAGVGMQGAGTRYPSIEGRPNAIPAWPTTLPAAAYTVRGSGSGTATNPNLPVPRFTQTKPKSNNAKAA